VDNESCYPMIKHFNNYSRYYPIKVGKNIYLCRFDSGVIVVIDFEAGGVLRGGIFGTNWKNKTLSICLTSRRIRTRPNLNRWYTIHYKKYLFRQHYSNNNSRDNFHERNKRTTAFFLVVLTLL
jgi:hypothetical protein